MSCRLAAALLMMTSTVAVADDLELTLSPSCAEIDTERDTLPPDQRETARRDLRRVLERQQLLVVDAGCTDRYAVSHVQTGDRLVVRIAGPHGVRRVKNVSLDNLPKLYARMVRSLIEPPPPADEPTRADVAPQDAEANAEVSVAAATEFPGANDAANLDGSDDGESSDGSDDSSDEVSPDRILYGQVGVGSHGLGFGVGYRRQAGESVALDLGLSMADDSGVSHGKLAAEALYVPHPRREWTPYVGGGIAYLDQTEHSMTGAGLAADMTAGISFARAGNSRMFAQADLTLPFFSLAWADGTAQLTTYSPIFAMTFGLGF